MTVFARLTLVFSISLLASCAARTQTETNAENVAEQKPMVALGDGGVAPFYRIASDTVPTQPGVFLREEPLQAHQTVPGASKGVRLLYISTDGHDGESIVTVSGSFLLLEGEAPEAGWPIILWSHGTLGIANVCAPNQTGYVPFHLEDLAQRLNQGYAIVASDYQGLGTLGTHPYLATRPAAHSNLDIIRAIKTTDYKLTEKVVVVGQSQGAGVAIATAAYAPGYTPEIELLGVVATGEPFFSPETLIAVQNARPKDKVHTMLGYNFWR